MNYSIIWQEVQSSEGKRPPGRFGNAHAKLGLSSVVIHGGCSWKKGSRFTFLDDLWLMRILSPTEVQWEPLSQRGQQPGPRAYHHLCIIGRKLYIFGGKSSHEDRSVCTGIHVYDYMSRSWYKQHLEQEEEPAGLGCSASVVEQQVFIFGGMTRGSVSSKTRVFQPSSSSWINLEVSGAIPPARCDHAAAVVNTSLYIHGGCSGPELFLSDLYQLETNTLVWTRIEQGSSVNIPRAGHSLTAHHSKDLYVFGGFNDVIYPDGAPITEDLCKFSIGQSRWKVPKPLPTGSSPIITYHHSAYVIHSHLYVIGGLGLHGMSNDVQVARLLSPSERQGGTLMDDESGVYDNLYDHLPDDQTANSSRRSSKKSNYRNVKTTEKPVEAINLKTSEILDSIGRIPVSRRPDDIQAEPKTATSETAPIESSVEMEKKPSLRPQKAVDEPFAEMLPKESNEKSKDVIDNGTDHTLIPEKEDTQTELVASIRPPDVRGKFTDDETDVTSEDQEELELTLKPYRQTFAHEESPNSEVEEKSAETPHRLQTLHQRQHDFQNAEAVSSDVLTDDTDGGHDDHPQVEPHSSDLPGTPDREIQTADNKSPIPTAGPEMDSEKISDDLVFVTHTVSAPEEKDEDTRLKSSTFPDNVSRNDEADVYDGTDSDNEEDVEDGDDDDESDDDSSIASSSIKLPPTVAKNAIKADSDEFDFDVQPREASPENLNRTQLLSHIENEAVAEPRFLATSSPPSSDVPGVIVEANTDATEKDSTVDDNDDAFRPSKIEIDNGNDDNDSSSDESELNAAERQQLELLSQTLPKEAS